MTPPLRHARKARGMNVFARLDHAAGSGKPLRDRLAHDSSIQFVDWDHALMKVKLAVER
jgi:hypothetical protein